MTTKRLTPEGRKADVLAAAVSLAARRGGFSTLTRLGIARQAECSEGTVSRYFSTMDQLRRAVMREAVAKAKAAAEKGAKPMPFHLSIIAQGVVAGDSQANKAPSTLKAAALETLAPRG